MPKPLTPAQHRALAHMRTTHDGTVSSGKGVMITTARALERADLITLDIRWGRVSHMGMHREPYFIATLTPAGWGEHPRPAAPIKPTPTPESDLHHGDTVRNIHTDSLGTWSGPSAYDPTAFSIDMGSSYVTTPAGCWVFVSRPEPATQATPSAPVEPSTPPDQDKPLDHAYSPTRIRYTPGMRITYRTRDGLWNHGPVTEIYVSAANGRTWLRFTPDAYQSAPARRPQKYMRNEPGKRHPITYEDLMTVPLDDKDLSPERL